jgi:UDP-2,3-diacylglucosamine pyrophosphatase LpxH
VRRDSLIIIAMIAVISDVHFEEEASDAIRGNDGPEVLTFKRNLHPAAYRSFIAAMAEQVRHRRLRDFELVLAGDLFDFNRTTLWFQDSLRPYAALEEFEPPLEAKLEKILDATVAEPNVRDALESFRLLMQGRYRQWSNDPDDMQELQFPAERVAIHYLCGNHDRVANSSPAMRRRIRELLGLKGDAEFGHVLMTDDPAVLIRHGHEYDPNNFGTDLAGSSGIPLEVPDRAYSEPTFGDFITIDVAVRLPHLFRRKYGDEEILKDKVLSRLYLRLLQFDDVRPQSALLDYLLDSSGAEFSEEQAWERLVPVIELLMDEVHENKFFRRCLTERAKTWTPALLDFSRVLLKMGAWRNPFARELSRKLSRHFLGGGLAGKPEVIAQREEVVGNGRARLVIAGHTHAPHVSLVSSDRDSDRFYINTGTWRNRIPATPDGRMFGRLKAMTYVMLFSSQEDPEGSGPQYGSFDYWTGFTRHWKRGDTREPGK